MQHIAKWPNLKLKTQPIQLLGSFTIDIVLLETRQSMISLCVFLPDWQGINGTMTFSKMTLSIMTFSIMTFSIMTFSIMAFSIMTFSIKTLIIMTFSTTHSAL